MSNGSTKTESKKARLSLALSRTAEYTPLMTRIELNTSMVPETPTPSADPSSNDDILKQIKQALDDLKKVGKIATIQICPQCKSPKLRSREPWYDIGGAMGITPPKYLCTRCGYWGRVVIEVTHADVDESVLDEILNADIESAQKLLNDLHQEHPIKEKE